MSRFSYNCEYADSAIDEVDDKGSARPEQILDAFDAFDWSSQVELASQLRQRSPTFSVVDAEEDRLFWVSAFDDGAGGALSFVNQYTYRGEVKRFLGLVRSVGPVSPQSRNLSREDARVCIEHFVSGDHKGLLDRLC